MNCVKTWTWNRRGDCEKWASIVLAVTVVIGLFFTLVPVQWAFAATTLNVTTTADNTTDDGFCSLREALSYTNGAPVNTNCGPDDVAPYTINVPEGTYTLTGGELQIGANGNVNVTITGAGAASTIIQQGDAGCLGTKTERVFNLDPNAYATSPGGVVVTISGVTISNGAAASFGGGAILGGGPGGDYLTLSNSVISNNCTNGVYSGAGVTWSMEGYLTISNTTFSGNAAGNQKGGALFYGADTSNSLTITNSTFTGNTSAFAGNAGGAIYIQNTGSNAPNVSINGSTFTNNQATNGAGVGGAIFMDGGTLNLGNTAANRFVGNTAGVSASCALEITGGAANATNNWWGCNAGPGGAGCDRANSSGGTLTMNPWVVLKTTASPGTINSGQSSTLTASVLQNSSSGSLTTAQVAALVGAPVTWTNAVSGSFSGQQTALQANGTATATFSHDGGGCGTVSGQTKIDNVQDGDASATASITVPCPQAPAITSANNTTFTVGATGTFTVTTTGFPTGASMVIGETGALPSGVTFTSNGDGTATLAGTPGAGTGGTYPITITAGNGVGADATQNFALTIGKATAVVTLSNLTHTWDGTPKTATATTDPTGFTVDITYDGSPTAPSAAGSYAVVATVNDSNYQGTATGTLVISGLDLTVTVAGSGTGTVTSVPSGISCSGGSCSDTFTGTVSLYATPSALSNFGGWSGDCSGTSMPCSVVMNGNKEVTATFNLAPLLRIGGTYTTLQAAYNAATSGAVIQLLDNTVAGTLNAGRNVAVTLIGGYNAGYASNPGSTEVTAPLTVGLGRITVDRIEIR